MDSVLALRLALRPVAVAEASAGEPYDLAVDTVRLWHGTTASRARRIAGEGFRQMDSSAAIAHTAREFDVDEGAVVAWLQEHGRFAVVQQRRSDSSWFAASPAKAARWAQRAPEARWEALWAVWCLREDRLDDWSPWAVPAAAAWHLRQRLGDAPAVVEVQVPTERIQDQRQQPIPAEWRQDHLQLIADGLVAEVSIALPVPARWVTGYEVVERRVDFTTAAGLFGKSTSELTAMVDSAKVVPCHEPELPGIEPWYWTVGELAQYRIL